MLKSLDNGDGTGTIRSSALTQDFEKAKMLDFGEIALILFARQELPLRYE